jgi:hypothetical protein
MKYVLKNRRDEVSGMAEQQNANIFILLVCPVC